MSKRTGRPLGKPRIPMEARFWRRVQIGTGCWEWTGVKDRDGYGKLSLPGEKAGNVRAHRFSYELHKGPIPTGLLVIHSCDNPGCVNPEHLRVGTNSDNLGDMAAKDRSTRGRRHPRVKLTEDRVRHIRALIAAGNTTYSVSKMVGVSPGAVMAIHLKRTWAWLE